jgi:hypothetical protein
MPWRRVGEVEIQLHAFLTSALDGGKWLASRPEERAPGTHWIGGWVGPRAGPDAVENIKKNNHILQTGKWTLVVQLVA